MKFVKGFIALGIAAAVLAGCGSNNNNSANAGKESTPASAATDATTTASIVNQQDPLISALSDKGNWIVAILNDMTVDKEIVVSGEFHDKGDSANAIYRKLALYTQDDDHNITASFTLTVPKMTVQSENFKIQGGTVKGDVYVEANGFNLDKTATIDGNLIFKSDDLKSSAVLDGKITGNTSVGE